MKETVNKGYSNHGRGKTNPEGKRQLGGPRGRWKDLEEM
jgi:hypothetical protein